MALQGSGLAACGLSRAGSEAGAQMESIDDDMKEAGGWMYARTALVVYVRLLAVAFLASGLRRWAVLLGPLAPGGDFFSLKPEWMVAVGFFAVFELVAAVGLWLLASWGTVVWLIAAITEMVLHTVFRETFGYDPVVVGFHGVTVFTYAVLTFFYERSRSE
jgi:hypothetical protein